MELVKKVLSDSYVAKNGKSYRKYNYYLVLDNGVWVCIKPSFVGKDNIKLDSVARIIIERD